jgi:hypothetical protein
MTVSELELLVGVLIVWIVTTGLKYYTCLRNVKTSIYQMTFVRIFIPCRIVGWHWQFKDRRCLHLQSKDKRYSRPYYSNEGIRERQKWQFFCSCDRASLMYSFKYNQQNAMLYNILYYCRCPTCFGLFLRPSSGAKKLYIQYQVRSRLAAATAIAVGLEVQPSPAAIAVNLYSEQKNDTTEEKTYAKYLETGSYFGRSCPGHLYRFPHSYLTMTST